jgi:hypothetical protein
MSEWNPVDPERVKVGDEIRFRVTHTSESPYTVTTEGVVTEVCEHGSFAFGHGEIRGVCNHRRILGKIEPSKEFHWFRKEQPMRRNGCPHCDREDVITWIGITPGECLAEHRR